MVEARRIISEKLREHQYREGYARSLEGKGVEWEGDNNVEHMWEQVKQAKQESAKEVCRSVNVGGKEYDRSGVGEEGYAALFAGCEGNERNGTRPIRSPCFTV